MDVLPPPRGAAVPVLLPPLRERVDCSSDWRGGSKDEKGEDIDEPGDEGEDQPELIPPSLLEPLLLPLVPPPEPPPSLRGAAEPPPSLRGTAEPVVFPFDVRSCAETTPERGRPATTSVRAQVTIR